MDHLAAAGDVSLDARDGIELPGREIAVRNADSVFAFQGAHQVGEGEGIEQTGFEKRFVLRRLDGLAGHLLKNFNDFSLVGHGESVLYWCGPCDRPRTVA